MIRFAAFRLVALVLALVSPFPLASCAKPGDKKALVPAADRVVAPAWTLPSADKAKPPVTLADYRGKIVVLNFWATWCPPCLAELPGFAAVQKAYAAKGVQFLGLSIDALNGDVNEIAPLTRNAGVTYPIALATREVIAAYGGIEGIPTTFFIDPSGHIVSRHVGGMEEDELKAELDALVAEAGGAGAK